MVLDEVNNFANIFAAFHILTSMAEYLKLVVRLEFWAEENVID